jgi:phosphate transport system substrate-binding protein
MIPKYFRCGDPSQKCRFAVTKEYLKKGTSGFSCPCANANCVAFREPVGFLKVHFKRFCVVAILLIVTVGALLFSGKNLSMELLSELQSRFAPMESALVDLAGRPTRSLEEKSASLSITAVERGLEELTKQAGLALGAASATDVAQSLQQTDQQISIAKHLMETLDQPAAGTGVNLVEAKMLLVKLQQLKDDVESGFESMSPASPSEASLRNEFLEEVKGAILKARQITASPPAGPRRADLEIAKKQVQTSLVGLTALRARLVSFNPVPVGPWAPGDASLRLAASGDLGRDLVVPLTAAWAGAEVMEGPQGKSFLSSSSKGKVLVEPCSVEEGFAKLAAGEIDVFFADRAPTDPELGSFGPAFRASRSVAEVVALDAVSLLVNPELPLDTFEIGKPNALRLAASPAPSILRQLAERFGITPAESLDIGGERAALSDPNVIVLGFYHTEGTNLRAKRLAVKASSEAMALKPSPFSIATEDYPLSYRIVAWTASKSDPEALGLVKFITSNEGQTIVSGKGFVDLRLRPMPGEVPPEIMAALGAALGVDRVTSAVRLSTNFRFEVGGARLDLKAQADLERLPRFVAESYSTHKLVILGFTDTDGGPEINLPLSKNRAEVVAADLRKFKVDTRSGGLGPAFPVDTNATDAGKAKNRRAEVWVVQPSSKP